MSDPAKTPEEIEDVLASIRRLVSDHGSLTSAVSERSSQAAPGDAVPEDPSADVPQDALVLTPSFRVVEPEDPWAPVAASDTEGRSDETEALVLDAIADAASDDAASAGGEADAPDMTGDNTTAWQPDDRLSRFDVVGGEDESTEKAIADAEIATELHDGASEGPSEDTTQNSEDPAEVTASDEDLGDLIRLDGAEGMAGTEPSGDSASSIEDFESETGDDNWPGENAEAALLSLVARRDPAASAPANAVEPNQEDALAETETGEADSAEPAPNSDTGADMAALTEALDLDPPSDPDTSAMGTVELADADRVDDPESAADELDTDELDTGDPAPIFSRRAQAQTEQVDRDVATAGDEVEDQTTDATPDESLEAVLDLADADEGILDEDTLREIIVDVVREELQGVLGQRITRNVRKMVRREIRLALAAEDLD